MAALVEEDGEAGLQTSGTAREIILRGGGERPQISGDPAVIFGGGYEFKLRF
jgi:hypothetical protein